MIRDGLLLLWMKEKQRKGNTVAASYTCEHLSPRDSKRCTSEILERITIKPFPLGSELK